MLFLFYKIKILVKRTAAEEAFERLKHKSKHLSFENSDGIDNQGCISLHIAPARRLTVDDIQQSGQTFQHYSLNLP